MGRRFIQEKDFRFSHLTSTQSDSNDGTANWLTEVFSAATYEPDTDHSSELADVEFDTSSTSVSPPSSNPEVTSIPRRKKPTTVSFVNVSGPPTKDGRNKARKLATIARKKDKKEQLRIAERKALLEALTISSDTAVPRVTVKSSSIKRSSSPELGTVSWFGSSRSDPFVKYPLELSRRDRQLLDHIFHSEFASIKPYKEAFFPVGLRDAAAFHQVIANLAVQLHVHRDTNIPIANEYEKNEVVAHHSCALAMIHKRLSDPEQATSDGTIATIIAMICYSHLTKDFVAWHSHIKGLRYLLDLQQDLRNPALDRFGSMRIGFFGLDTLLGPALAWIDTNGSATQDIRPRFPLHPYACFSPSPDLEFPPSATALSLSKNLSRVFPSGKPIFDLLTDTAILAAKFTAELEYSSPRKLYADPIWGWTHVYPVAHNILSYRELVDGDKMESVVKESCRLGLSIYVTNVRRQFGVAPLVLDTYVDQLLPLLSNKKLEGDWGKFNLFKLWVLVVGAMEARGDVRRGLLGLLKGLARMMGIRNHKELGERVRELIWIDEIDSGRFGGLEKDLMASGTIHVAG